MLLSCLFQACFCAFYDIIQHTVFGDQEGVVRHNFFTNRIVNSWNSLPSDIVSASSVAAFKKRLDDFWAETRYGHSQRPAAYNP